MFYRRLAGCVPITLLLFAVDTERQTVVHNLLDDFAIYLAAERDSSRPVHDSLKALDEREDFFSLKLRYRGEELVEAKFGT